GRPDLKAKLDIALLPLYIGVAWLLIARFGVTGAAGAKLLFTAFDAALLFRFAHHLGAPPLLDGAWLRRHALAAGCVLAVIALLGAAVAAPLGVRVTAAAIAMLLLAPFWKHALEPGDRAALRGLFSRARLTTVTP